MCAQERARRKTVFANTATRFWSTPSIKWSVVLHWVCTVSHGLYCSLYGCQFRDPRGLVHFPVAQKWFTYQIWETFKIWVKNVNSAKWIVYISILLNISKYGLCRIRGAWVVYSFVFEMMFVFSFFELWNFLILTWNGPEFVEDSQFECAIVSGRYYEHWRLQRVVGRYYTKKGITRDTEAHLQPMPDTFSTKGCPCSAHSIEFPHPNGELGSSKQPFFDILFRTVWFTKKWLRTEGLHFVADLSDHCLWNGYCRYKILLGSVYKKWLRTPSASDFVADLSQNHLWMNFVEICGLGDFAPIYINVETSGCTLFPCATQ